MNCNKSRRILVYYLDPSGIEFEFLKTFWRRIMLGRPYPKRAVGWPSGWSSTCGIGFIRLFLTTPDSPSSWRVGCSGGSAYLKEASIARIEPILGLGDAGYRIELADMLSWGGSSDRVMFGRGLTGACARRFAVLKLKGFIRLRFIWARGVPEACEWRSEFEIRDVTRVS